MAHQPTVSSFAPELLTVFHKAAQEPLAITVENEKAAIRLRFRLHQLRRAMKREMHEWAEIAEMCQVTIHLGPGDGITWLVAVGPADQGILPALKSAGVEVEDIPLPAHEKQLSKTAIDHYLTSDPRKKKEK